MNKKQFRKKLLIIASAGAVGIGFSVLSMIQAKLPTAKIVGISLATLFLGTLTITLSLLYTRKHYEDDDNAADSAKILPQIKDTQLNSFTRKMIAVLKWGTIPAIGIALVMMYDAFSPATAIEKATVLQKHLNQGKGAYAYIRVQDIETGKSDDNESNRDLYDTVQPGDTLIIHKTARMELWKLVELDRNGVQIGSFNEVQTHGVIKIILLFFIPLLSFFLSADKPMRPWVQNYQMGIWVAVPIIELASLGLWYMFFIF